MLPTFSNNDYVMTRHTRSLKRIKSLYDGEFQVSSDNKAYESEICNKKYNFDDILGKVIFKLSF